MSPLSIDGYVTRTTSGLRGSAGMMSVQADLATGQGAKASSRATGRHVGQNARLIATRERLAVIETTSRRTTDPSADRRRRSAVTKGHPARETTFRKTIDHNARLRGLSTATTADLHAAIVTLARHSPTAHRASIEWTAHLAPRTQIVLNPQSPPAPILATAPPTLSPTPPQPQSSYTVTPPCSPRSAPNAANSTNSTSTAAA